ncbi:MAG: hypothetical protein V3U34_00580 [candidate division NC10 bacterium]
MSEYDEDWCVFEGCKDTGSDRFMMRISDVFSVWELNPSDSCYRQYGARVRIETKEGGLFYTSSSWELVMKSVASGKAASI